MGNNPQQHNTKLEKTLIYILLFTLLLAAASAAFA
jgi:hypothetical protein